MEQALEALMYNTIKIEDDGTLLIMFSHNKKPLKLTASTVFVVPRAGIEPATRGFSVPCSTD